MRRRDFLRSGALICFSSIASVLVGCDFNNLMPCIKQPYPSQPIKFIVPYSPGSTSDIIARLMEKFSIKYFGQPFVTTNMLGGGGILGMNELASAKPDGYTIGVVTVTALLQHNYGQTRYNYPTALEPLVQVTSSSMAMAVLAESPWTNIYDLINYAKKNPGKIKYAHAGLGTLGHVVGETFAKTADINIAQVPFQGDSESLAALLGGHVQALLAYYPAISEYAKTGKIKVLAVATEQGLNISGNNKIHSFKEQGIDVVFSSWHGIVVPKMIPINVRERLESGLIGVVNDPEFQTNMLNVGMPVDLLEPEEFKKKWNNETMRLAKIVKDTGIAEKIAMQKN